MGLTDFEDVIPAQGKEKKKKTTARLEEQSVEIVMMVG